MGKTHATTADSAPRPRAVEAVSVTSKAKLRLTKKPEPRSIQLPLFCWSETMARDDLVLALQLVSLALISIGVGLLLAGKSCGQ